MRSMSEPGAVRARHEPRGLGVAFGERCLEALGDGGTQFTLVSGTGGRECAQLPSYRVGIEKGGRLVRAKLVGVTHDSSDSRRGAPCHGRPRCESAGRIPFYYAPGLRSLAMFLLKRSPFLPWANS